MNIKKFLKENKFAILIIFIVGLITYFIKLSTYSFSIDTEALLTDYDSQLFSWLSIQRYGLVLIKKIYSISNHNLILTNILSFILLFISIIIYIYQLNYIKNESSRMCNILLGTILITSPIIVEQFNFTLQVFEITLALLLFNIAFICINIFINNKKYILFLISIFLISFSFSCYQSFLPLYILYSISFYFIDNKDEEKINKIIITYVAIFIISYLLYEIFANIIMYIYNVQRTNYLSEQTNWGKENIFITLARTIICIGGTLIPILRPYSYNIGLLVCLSIFFIFFLNSLKKQKYVKALAFFGFFITIFSLNIIIGGYAVVRAQIMIPYATAFATYYIIPKLENTQKIFVAFMVSIVAYQLIISNLLFYTDYNSYKKQIDLAHKIYEQIDKNKPIVFFGTYESNGKGILLKSETMGKTFFEWDNKINVASNGRIYGFFKAIGLDYIFPNEELIEKGTNKGIFQKEFICDYDNYIVVNLNNIKE